MPDTLLVVDGRGFPRPLTERLEAVGHVCLYARGPLRAQALLAQHKVDLILWKDNTGSADLSAELFAAWRQYPAIPVLRMFPKGRVAPAGAAAGWEQHLAANVPATLPEKELVLVVARCLDARAARQAAQAPGNELAFRQVVTALRGHAAISESPGAGLLLEGDAPLTSVGDAERALLRAGEPAQVGEAGTTQGVLSRVWARWVGPRRALSVSSG